MQQDLEHIELVRQAMAGDPDSLSALAELAQPRLCAYVRRVVLDFERAEDIAQETIMAMLASRDQLRDPSRFWSWLFSIVNNKIRLFYRRADLHPRAFSDSRTVPPEPRSHEPEPAEGLARSELVALTRSAIAELEVRHRMVLAMRFYEDLPHSEISSILGCSESTARVTFLRAKRALILALRKRGIREGALGLALAAFGQATQPAAAGAAQVSAAALAEATKWLLPGKQLFAAAAALFALTVLLPWTRQAPANRMAAPVSRVLSVHFTEQAESAQCQMDFAKTSSRGAYEQWLRFPEGAGGPFLTRTQLWNPFLTAKICYWIQNESANYHIESAKTTINNARLYSPRVKTLPTDDEELLQFIRQVEEHGAPGRATTTPAEQTIDRDPQTQRMRKKVDYRFPELGPFETVYDFADLPASLFEKRVEGKIVDQRDEMHFRGWTWFRIEGTLGGRQVKGAGQIPFVYSAYKTHRPWLSLRIEGRREIADISSGAWITPDGSASSGRHSDLPAESFFCGLPRPWSGLHTIDVIRRDAAAHRVWFETILSEEEKQSAIVRLIDRQFTPALIAEYRIDVERDLLEQVIFTREGVTSQPADVLDFYYIQNLELLDEKLTAPTAPGALSGESATHGPGPLWPYLLSRQDEI